jgi:hypothetical protein
MQESVAAMGETPAVPAPQPASAEPTAVEAEPASAPPEPEPDAAEPEPEAEAFELADPPEPEAEAASAPAPSGSTAPEGARLVALNMALSGKPREETASYLRENFDLDDADALLDDVYARAGS